MEYRRLGNSGLKISALSLGSWLTLGEKLDNQTAEQLIDTAVACGINMFDAADGYANGEAERQLGVLLEKHNRSRLVLSSKAFWPMSDDPNDRGLSRKHLFDSVHRSLKNLRSDYLDIFFCHRQDKETPLEETVMAMNDLITQGKILYWGTSMWNIDVLKKAIRFAKKYGFHAPITEQLPYNLLERWLEKKLNAYRRLGTGVMTWSPLAGGILTGKYCHGVPQNSRGAQTEWVNEHLNDHTNNKVVKFLQIAKELGVAPAQLALAWLLKTPGVSSIICGASCASQLQNNLASLDLTLSSATDKQLNQLFPL